MLDDVAAVATQAPLSCPTCPPIYPAAIWLNEQIAADAPWVRRQRYRLDRPGESMRSGWTHLDKARRRGRGRAERQGSQLLEAPVISPLGLAVSPALTALESVLFDLDATEALGAAPPLLRHVAFVPPRGRLPFLAAAATGSGGAAGAASGNQRRPGTAAQVLLVVLAVVVPAVIQAVEALGIARAPRVIARVRCLGRRLPVHVPVVPLQIRLALERPRVASRLQAGVGVGAGVPRSWSAEGSSGAAPP